MSKRMIIMALILIVSMGASESSLKLYNVTVTIQLNSMRARETYQIEAPSQSKARQIALRSARSKLKVATTSIREVRR